MANPNPIPHWKKGQSGNPGGKTSEQRKNEVRNAELATAIRMRLLEALHQTLEQELDNAATLERIQSDVLKLIKDSEDRGLGAPKASVDLTSEDGSMSPKPAIDVSKLSTETLAEIMRAADAAKSS